MNINSYALTFACTIADNLLHCCTIIMIFSENSVI